VISLTKTAAVEYSSQGVRINAVLPGAIETPMMAKIFEETPALRDPIVVGPSHRSHRHTRGDRHYGRLPAQRRRRIHHRGRLRRRRRLHGGLTKTGHRHAPKRPPNGRVATRGAIAAANPLEVNGPFQASLPGRTQTMVRACPAPRRRNSAPRPAALRGAHAGPDISWV